MKESQDSSEMGSGHSSSVQSPPTHSSRPTSLYSSGSFGAYSWGLPLPPEPEAYAKAGQKQRRMRRFPSGTASLKPLLLPNAAAAPSLPTSAPIQATCRDTPQRDFSHTSMDPTIAFLSTHELSSPIDTPTQPRRNRSTTCAQREALSTLEGRLSPSIDKDEFYSIQSPRSFSEELLETVEEEQSDIKPPKKERPRSLGEELADAGLLSAISVDDGLIPYSDQSIERRTEPESVSTGTDASHLCFSNKRKQACEPTDYETTPRTAILPAKLRNPTPKASASTSVASRHAHGLFSRLKSLMLRTKQGPSELARRIIHSAWAIGIGKLGGVGWWLLGLVYGSRLRKRKRAADVETIVEEVPAPSMDWHHFSPTSSGRSASQPYKHHEVPGGILPNQTESNPSRQTFYSSPDDSPHKDPLVPRHEPHLIPCPDCTEPSSRRSLRLWFRFSLAIVVAVGLAIKDGPGSLLAGCDASNERLHETWQSTPRKTRLTPTDGRRSRLLHSSTAHAVTDARPSQYTARYGTING
ncbi:MAG: hypothetical protein Q9224_005570 [Gallowayella concinna]